MTDQSHLTRTACGPARPAGMHQGRQSEGGHALRASPGRAGPAEPRQTQFHPGGAYAPQSIGRAPCNASQSFTREKGREPKKPRRAERGDGWAVSITR